LLDEDEEVAYGFEELDELTHAHAVSLHRSQGSEYPCVVVPVTTSAWLMLQRNLLYTAVTRAKRIVVLVGSRRALAKAVQTQGAGRRYTALTERLQQGRARRLRWSAGLGRAGCNGFRSSPTSGSAIGSGRRDGQGDARAAHQLGHQGVADEGSVTCFACTAWNDSLRTHYFMSDAQRRPGKTPLRTALSPRLLIRMRSQVQVLAGPPPIVAGHSAVGGEPGVPAASLGRAGAARPSPPARPLALPARPPERQAPRPHPPWSTHPSPERQPRGRCGHLALQPAPVPTAQPLATALRTPASPAWSPAVKRGRRPHPTRPGSATDPH
jgi:hypothetical protein